MAFSDWASQWKNRISQMKATDYAVRAREIYDSVMNPVWTGQLEVTRTSQWIAAILLPVLIMITLPLIVVLMDITGGILQEPLGSFTALTQFLITAIALGVFILSAYFWFLWVRTGGFGLCAFPS